MARPRSDLKRQANWKGFAFSAIVGAPSATRGFRSRATLTSESGHKS